MCSVEVLNIILLTVVVGRVSIDNDATSTYNLIDVIATW